MRLVVVFVLTVVVVVHSFIRRRILFLEAF